MKAEQAEADLLRGAERNLFGLGDFFEFFWMISCC